MIALPETLSSRYTLKEPLGDGAMAVVHRAEDIHSGASVAIKFLRRGLSAQLLSRFLAEGRLMRELKTPNVVGLLDIGECDGSHYLVAEYVDGGSLREKLHAVGKFSGEQALSIILDVLEGLRVIHERGVVHRDLKPDNILLTSSGRAKLADLGIAKEYGNEAEHMTHTGVLIGTPRYMAPEQLRGEAAVIASDLYSCGLLLYEMLTGTPVVLGKNIYEVIGFHRSQGIPNISQRVPNLSPKLAAIVTRTLSANVQDRPESAETLATALRRVRSEVNSVVSAPPGLARYPLPDTTSTTRKKPYALPGAAGIVALAAVSFLVIGTRRGVRSHVDVHVRESASPLPSPEVSPVAELQPVPTPSPAPAKTPAPELSPEPPASPIESTAPGASPSPESVAPESPAPGPDRFSPEYQIDLAQQAMVAGQDDAAADAMMLFSILSAAQTATTEKISTWLAQKSKEHLDQATALKASPSLPEALQQYYLSIKCDRSMLSRLDPQVWEQIHSYLDGNAKQSPKDAGRALALGVFSYLLGNMTQATASLDTAEYLEHDPYRRWIVAVWRRRVQQELVQATMPALRPSSPRIVRHSLRLPRLTHPSQTIEPIQPAIPSLPSTRNHTAEAEALRSQLDSLNRQLTGLDPTGHSVRFSMGGRSYFVNSDDSRVEMKRDELRAQIAQVETQLRNLDP